MHRDLLSAVGTVLALGGGTMLLIQVVWRVISAL